MAKVEILEGARSEEPAKLGTVVNSAVRITQFFGDRPDYYAKFGYKGHPGVDLVAGVGTIITAAHDGKVIEDGDNGDGYGTRVVIWDEQQNIKSIYAHLQDEKVRKGTKVQEGDLIGHLGSTGNSTGPHLHFGVMRTKDRWTAGNLFGGKFEANSEPLHSDNGYLGWEDPRDDTLFDWYRGGFGFDQGTPEEQLRIFMPDELTPAQKAASFDTIFKLYYIGWDRQSAEQDFLKAYGSDLNKLKAARGITGEEKKKARPIPQSVLTKTYTLNPAYGGMSLQEISSGGIPLGRVDKIAEFLGVPPDQKLQPGREFSLSQWPPEYYPNSSEWSGFLKLTAKGEVGKAGDYFLLPQYNQMTLREIQGISGLPFRSDILASYLGISDNMVLSSRLGFGIGGFPNFYDEGSGEVQAFKKLFTTTAPAAGQTPSAAPAPETPTKPETSIRIDSTPEKAKFYIDGLYFTDLTPSNKAYPVTPGTHLVRVEKSGYQPQQIQVEVLENEEKVVEFELVKTGATAPEEQKVGELGTAIAVEALAVRVSKIEKILSEKGLL